ncbi:hypothetical protein ACFY00_11720 [Kitasatospora sp. NPDC001540]|uniref:hypothetical protein n=1 Tax=Kitasatospora sp. NPDC001540 TaxID=3364014 RepID=UPI0036B1AD9B
MPSTEQDRERARSIDSLRSIWAAGGQPVPPWHRRVTRRQVGVTAGCLAVLLVACLAIRSLDSEITQHRVALPTGFANLPRVAEDQDLRTLRAEYEAQRSRRYVPRVVQVQGYGQPGATGLRESELLAVAMEGSFPDAAQAATAMLGGYSPTGGSLRDGTPVVGSGPTPRARWAARSSARGSAIPVRSRRSAPGRTAAPWAPWPTAPASSRPSNSPTARASCAPRPSSPPDADHPAAPSPLRPAATSTRHCSAGVGR